MRKDLLLLFLAISVVVANYGYEKLMQVLQKKRQIERLERKKRNVAYQLERIRRLREKGEAAKSATYYSILLEKEPPENCMVTVGKKERREGTLFFYPAEIRCNLLEWGNVSKVIKKLKDYPISIEGYSYKKGVLRLKVKIYGSKP